MMHELFVSIIKETMKNIFCHCPSFVAQCQQEKLYQLQTKACHVKCKRNYVCPYFVFISDILAIKNNLAGPATVAGDRW
jgi:hypothetical protein